jgi:hypothetical protein
MRLQTLAKILIAERSINLDEVQPPRPNGVGVLLLELLVRANFPPSTMDWRPQPQSGALQARPVL